MSDLGAVTDRLTEALIDAEVLLANLRLGVSADVPLGAHVLRFGKQGPDWCFVVVDSSGGETRLAKMSRALRVEAASQLDALFVALLREHANQLTVVQEAAQRVEAFVERIEALSRENATPKPGVTEPSESTGES